jgi:hypothetical protein
MLGYSDASQLTNQDVAFLGSGHSRLAPRQSVAARIATGNAARGMADDPEVQVASYGA